MDADLDLLCISVYCTADDLLPEPGPIARRRQSDAEIVALCVVQVLMGIPSVRRFLRRLDASWGTRSLPATPRPAAQAPGAPGRHDGVARRRLRRAEPGPGDQLVLLDSTPVECGRSFETARRSQLTEICGYSYSRSHSRCFWGMRQHLACAPGGTPSAVALVAADRPEREVGLGLLPRALRARRNVVCAATV